MNSWTAALVVYVLVVVLSTLIGSSTDTIAPSVSKFADLQVHAQDLVAEEDVVRNTVVPLVECSIEWQNGDREAKEKNKNKNKDKNKDVMSYFPSSLSQQQVEETLFMSMVDLKHVHNDNGNGNDNGKGNTMASVYVVWDTLSNAKLRDSLMDYSSETSSPLWFPVPFAPVADAFPLHKHDASCKVWPRTFRKSAIIDGNSDGTSDNSHSSTEDIWNSLKKSSMTDNSDTDSESTKGKKNQVEVIVVENEKDAAQLKKKKMQNHNRNHNHNHRLIVLVRAYNDANGQAIEAANRHLSEVDALLKQLTSNSDDGTKLKDKDKGKGKGKGKDKDKSNPSVVRVFVTANNGVHDPLIPTMLQTESDAPHSMDQHQHGFIDDAEIISRSKNARERHSYGGRVLQQSGNDDDPNRKVSPFGDTVASIRINNNPELFAGMITMLFLIISLLIFFYCMAGIQSPTYFAKSYPQKGKEFN